MFNGIPVQLETTAAMSSGVTVSRSSVYGRGGRRVEREKGAGEGGRRSGAWWALLWAVKGFREWREDGGGFVRCAGVNVERRRGVRQWYGQFESNVMVV